MLKGYIESSDEDEVEAKVPQVPAIPKKRRSKLDNIQLVARYREDPTKLTPEELIIIKKNTSVKKLLKAPTKEEPSKPAEEEPNEKRKTLEDRIRLLETQSERIPTIGEVILNSVKSIEQPKPLIVPNRRRR